MRSLGRFLGLERGSVELARMSLDNARIGVQLGEERESVPVAAVRDGLLIEDARYDVKVDRDGRGSILDAAGTVATVLVRQPDHGTVCLLDMVRVPPSPARVFAYAGAIAYARGVALRRKPKGKLWGKENALDDIIELAYLDMRTDNSGFDIGGGGASESHS